MNRMRHGLMVAAFGLVAARSPAMATPRSGSAECRGAQARTEVLAAVRPRGDIVLASGAQVVLGSLRWPDDPDTAAAAADRLLMQRGRPLIVVVRGEADRWGRLRIDAVSEDGTIDLAGDLVASGLARVDAGEGDVLCRPGLLAVEETARKGGLGLWRRPPLDAADGAGLRAAAGRFAVVEGTIRHVGERPTRTYLDFAGRGEDGLTVTVSKRTWRRMREHGLSADRLRGRMVRVRGVVEIRRGPTLDVVVPETIEVLETPAAVAGRDSGNAADRAAGEDGERAQRR